MDFVVQAEDGILYWSVTGVQTCALLFSSRRRHTRLVSDWSSDVCSSDLHIAPILVAEDEETDAMLLRWAFEKAGVPNPLVVARDGQEAEIGRASCRERV